MKRKRSKAVTPNEIMGYSELVAKRSRTSAAGGGKRATRCRVLQQYTREFGSLGTEKVTASKQRIRM
jgi:hypothetical protein